MSRRHTHPEADLVFRIGWLRAPVPGASNADDATHLHTQHLMKVGSYDRCGA